MVLGYNEERPTERQYHNFIKKLINGLEKLGNNDLSLMLYGSYVRGDSIYGKSDIDAVLTLPYDVVTDKEFLSEVSAVLYNALKKNNVKFQVSPLDTGILRDGRFNSFTSDFYNYFLSEGKIIFGPDYREEMNCLHLKTGEESTLSHNLRKIRQSLLLAKHNKLKDYKKFLEGFNSTLDAVSRGSKQILFLADGKLRKNRFSALEELSRFFPSVNTEPLRRIKFLYYHLGKLDKLYRKSTELMQVWNSALTFFEEVIRGYIRQFPLEE